MTESEDTAAAPGHPKAPPPPLMSRADRPTAVRLRVGAVRAVVDSAFATLARAGVEAGDVDWFVPHQANLRIIESAANHLGFLPEKTIVNIDRFGNTSAASIPLALAEAHEDGRLSPDDLVLLSGFGAGMAWGSALVRWGSLSA